jgi:copper chaperone CopZ
MKFQIDNMTCGGCARSVTKAIHSVDPHAKVDIDLPRRASTWCLLLTSQRSRQSLKMLDIRPAVRRDATGGRGEAKPRAYMSNALLIS